MLTVVERCCFSENVVELENCHMWQKTRPNTEFLIVRQ